MAVPGSPWRLDRDLSPRQDPVRIRGQNPALRRHRADAAEWFTETQLAVQRLANEGELWEHQCGPINKIA